MKRDVCVCCVYLFFYFIAISECPVLLCLLALLTIPFFCSSRNSAESFFSISVDAMVVGQFFALRDAGAQEPCQSVEGALPETLCILLLFAVSSLPVHPFRGATQARSDE